MRTILILIVLSTFAGAATSPGVPQSAGGQVYKPGDGVTSPVVVKEVKPSYAAGAMRPRVEGTVVVSCIVKVDGAVDDCTVTRSLDAELDQEAVNAAKQWQFKPGTKDGKPVAVEVSIELSFSMRSGSPVYRPGAGVSSPEIVKEVKPDYPEEAKQAGVGGTVELEGVIQIDESIDSIRVTRSIDERLDQEAVKSLGQWRFKPGQKDGQAVRVLISVEMSFTVR